MTQSPNLFFWKQLNLRVFDLKKSNTECLSINHADYDRGGRYCTLQYGEGSSSCAVTGPLSHECHTDHGLQGMTDPTQLSEILSEQYLTLPSPGSLLIDGSSSSQSWSFRSPGTQISKPPVAFGSMWGRKREMLNPKGELQSSTFFSPALLCMVLVAKMAGTD